ncbi:hypothetical protein ABIA09_000212 [Bradyrhizobium yuanmingense]
MAAVLRAALYLSYEGRVTVVRQPQRPDEETGARFVLDGGGGDRVPARQFPGTIFLAIAAPRAWGEPLRGRLYSRRQHGAPGARTRSPRMRVTILSRAVDTINQIPEPFSDRNCFRARDTRLHVGASEPDGAAASRRRIAAVKMICSSARMRSTLCGLISGRPASCFDRARRSRHLRGPAELIELHGRVAAALRDIVRCLGIVDRRERDPERRFRTICSSHRGR